MKMCGLTSILLKSLLLCFMILAREDFSFIFLQPLHFCLINIIFFGWYYEFLLPQFHCGVSSDSVDISSNSKFMSASLCLSTSQCYFLSFSMHLIWSWTNMLTSYLFHNFVVSCISSSTSKPQLLCCKQFLFLTLVVA